MRRRSDLRTKVEVPDLTGKVVLITGASSGIGQAAALRMAAAGATVLVHGRSPERTAEVAGLVGTDPLVADFGRFADVRRLAVRVCQSVDRLDVVMHNAGALVPERTVTVDGHELTFQANHLATFLLQKLLQPMITATPDSRIIVTSSAASRVGRVDLDDLEYRRRRYSPFGAYAASKLENVLFVKELSRRLMGTGAVAAAVNPGPVATAFGAGSIFPGIFYRVPISTWFLLSAETGAEPLVRLATLPSPEDIDGRFYDRLSATRPPRRATDPSLARGLWEISEEAVGQWVM